MTFAAGHLTKAYRVLGCLVKFRANFLVAAEAYFGLCFFLQYRIFGSVNSVTTGTGDISAAVSTAQPVDMLAVLMAAEAGCILFFHRFVRFDAKIENGWPLLPRPYLAYVPPLIQHFLQGFGAGNTWAMAGFALQPGEG